jgi:hypothetical protein
MARMILQIQRMRKFDFSFFCKYYKIDHDSADIQVPSVITSVFLYLRLIAEKSTVNEKHFRKIQKDRSEEMQSRANKLKMVQQTKAHFLILYSRRGPTIS